MSVTLDINGVYYYYPEQGDVNWGTDATDWASAVTTGMLQKKGGTFTLTAEVDFGATYGLKSAYFKSKTTNPASAGLIRLARTDVISWRNQANSANLDLSVDSSNNLLFNGVDISSPSTVAWGAITGTLSAQTDLQTALDLKVTGPASATANALARFDSTTGKLIKNSGVTLDNSENATGFKTIFLRNDDDLSAPSDPMIRLDNQNASATSAAHVEYRRSGAATANLANNDVVGRQDYHARHNSSWLSVFKSEVIYTGNGTTRLGDYVLFTANGSAPAERLRITAAGSIQVSGLTASRALATDGSKGLVSSTTTATELGYLSGVTSAIQTQLNAKQATGSYITALTGDVTASGPGSVAAAVAFVGGASAASVASAVTLASAALPSASFTDAAVTSKLITGYSSGSGIVAATDTILQAINKLNGNDLLKAPLNSPTFTGTVVTPSGIAFIAPDLGTPTSGVMTNVTGTASGLTSGVTNALKSATTDVNVSSATAPSSGQVLTATSSTAATWQTPSAGSGPTIGKVFNIANSFYFI